MASIRDLPPCAGRGVSRRGFCAGAGAGLVTIGVAGCDAFTPRTTLGAVDNQPGEPHGGDDAGVHEPFDAAGTNQPPPDFAQNNQPPPDLAQNNQPPPDLAQQVNNNCSGPLNAGKASAIAMNGTKHFTDNVSYDLYVVRDSGGLYALNASCPHAGCTVKEQQGQWYCPCHGATFDLNGQNPTAPAFSPLDHYSLCIDGSGNVLVDYNTTVSPSTRV
jgi:cytochrome b6-f complex iron-sulfur subunit